MNRNYLYVLIAILAVVVAIFGYQLYEAQQKPNGVEIKLDSNGVSIQQK